MAAKIGLYAAFLIGNIIRIVVFLVDLDLLKSGLYREILPQNLDISQGLTIVLFRYYTYILSRGRRRPSFTR